MAPDEHIFAQNPPQSFPHQIDRRGRERLSRSQDRHDRISILLNDSVLLYAGNVIHRTRHHHRGDAFTVLPDEEIFSTAFDDLHKGQVSAAGAPPPGGNAHIANAISYEGHRKGMEVRHDDIAGLTWFGISTASDEFDDQCVNVDMVSIILLTLPRDVSTFSRGVSVEDVDTESGVNELAIFLSEQFGGCRDDGGRGSIVPGLKDPLGNQPQAGWIAMDEVRPTLFQHSDLFRRRQKARDVCGSRQTQEMIPSFPCVKAVGVQQERSLVAQSKTVLEE